MDDTVVKINNRIVATLNSGEFHEQIIVGSAIVESNRPFLLVQYSNGASFDSDDRVTLENYNAGIRFDGNLRETPENYADPFMIVVPPVSQYLSDYIVTTPTSELPFHFVNLVVPSNAIDSVTIDGDLVESATFTEIGQSGYFGAGLPISEGAHSIKANANFGLYVYGYGEWESYGYLGGMALSNQLVDAASVAIELVNNEANQAGSTTCALSTVIDSSGDPIHNTNVDFSVSGVSSLTKRVFTNSDGVAELCYSGLSIGVDTITAGTGNVSGSETFTWLANNSAANIAPKITSLPTTRVYAGDSYQYQIVAQDANSDSLNITVSGLPSGATFNASTKIISWEVSSDQSTANLGSVTVSVSDGRGGVDEQRFNMESLGIRNEPTVITGVTRYGFIVGRNTSSQILPTYLRTESLVHSIENRPDGMQVTGGLGGFNWTPAIDQVGEHDITLVISESRDNGVSRKDITVVVAESNDLPIFTSQPPSYGIVGEPLFYDADAYDPEGYPVVFGNVTLRTNTQQASPAIDPDSGEMTWTPTRAGTYTFSIGANDPFYRSFQVYEVIVKDTNLPPTITSEPLLGAVIDQDYTYQVAALDPDGDALTYSLVTAPEVMTIDAQGLITWSPSAADIGTQSVTVLVDDGFGEQDSQTFTITVVGDNAAPEFTVFPAISVLINSNYSYTPEATDADGDSVSFTMTSDAPGISFDAVSNVLSWTPTEADIGDYTVSIFASDGIATTELLYILSVTDLPNTLPVITSSAPTAAAVGNAYEYQVVATDDNGDVLSYSLSGSPTGAAVDVNTGLITWTPTSADLGLVSFDVLVWDGESEISQTIEVTVRNDNGAPLVEIRNPDYLAAVTAPVNVGASVQDDDLVSWRLVLQRKGMTALTELATGTQSVDSDNIAVFDPTMLINGIYTLAIIAEDSAGNTTTEGTTVVVDGDLKVGNFTITFNDLSIPMVGIPIEVNRTYDSRRRSEDLDFGYGWTIDYQNVEVSESRTPGVGWEYVENTAGVIFGDPPEFCVQPLGTPTVTVRLPDDTLEEFDVELEEPCHVIPVLDGRIVFKPKAGTTSELTALENTLGRITVATGEFGPVGGNPIDPDRYELTTKAGYIYVLNQSFGIETVTDPNGHVLTYSDTGIVHSAGKRIDFVRDANGRITEITDPSGALISYNYDAAYDLVAVTDREFATTEFTYNNNHGLVDIFDPLGRRLIRNVYNDEGRLIAQEDEQGIRTEFNHNISGRESIVTDRLGRTTAFYYDDRGNVTSKVDALGQTYTYSYDQYDNQLSETNPLGHTTTASFDDRYNQLSQTDALGNTVTYAYNSLGQETTIVDARGNTFNNTYDGVGNLLTVTDPLGNVAGQNINSQGLASLRRDAENNDTTFEYDGKGNTTKETDAEGGVTTYTYDANNNRLTESRTRTVGGVASIDTTTYEYNDRDQVIKTTDALGNVTLTEYDQLARESAQIDAKGRRTTMAYDSYGRLVTTTYPDGTSSNSTYDVEGNKLSDTDRLGRTTQFNYDALNRVVTTTYPDSAAMSTAYDAAGRTVSETDARGNAKTHSYDAANRRLSTTDAIGNTVSFTYDADGNMLTQTDARGYTTTTYTYNALDQRVQTLFADNTSVTSAFDKRGLEIAKTDQNGRTTEFDYDGLGRLESVTDALNQVTRYGYDEVGNKLTQTDALNRVTSWAYDAINRPVSRTLPLGQKETYAYDAVGNRTSHTDFNGATHTFSYDANNDWLTTENWADGNSISYSYNAIGQRTDATDANGTFTYSYDNRDRLTSEVKHDGSELLYGYDANGNRTTLTTLVAGVSSTATYTFDALNRMASVTDANGNITSYTFDANSNQTRIDQANGTATTMIFDALNRVTQIAHLDATNAPLATLTYTLDPTGRRTAINEANGRTSSYTYDDLYRLTGESISDPDNGTHTSSYQYDAVSNRIQATVNGVSTNYTVDDNDRLLANAADSYSYDANGNTISEVVSGQTNTYTYDSRNKLINAVMGGASQNMAYDPDGARIQKSLGGDTVDYLVDSNRDYAQVLVERSAAEELNYTFGLDLVGMDTGAEQYTYHSDALGSTRALSDSSGSVVDDIRYDAWGEVLSAGDVAANQYLYTGEQFDFGLDKQYLRARYYSPGVGRFSQMDVYQGSLKSTISQNKYLYANGQPSNGTDPTGYFFYGEQAAAMNATQALINVVGASYAIMTKISMSYSTLPEKKRELTPLDVDMGKMEIRRCQRSMGRNCNSRLPIIFYGRDVAPVTEHIFYAFVVRGLTPILNRRDGNWGDWRGSVPECKGRSNLIQCDEYPFNSTLEGGPENYKNGNVSLRLLNGRKNGKAGGQLSAFYRSCGIDAASPIDRVFGVVATVFPKTIKNRCGLKR